MEGGLGTGWTPKYLGKFHYLRKIEQQDNVEYVFPGENFYNFLHQQSKKGAKGIVSYQTSSGLSVSHVEDCTIISQGSKSSRCSLRVINPDRSKRNKAISKLVEILK